MLLRLLRFVRRQSALYSLKTSYQYSVKTFTRKAKPKTRAKHINIIHVFFRKRISHIRGNRGGVGNVRFRWPHLLPKTKAYGMMINAFSKRT